MEEYNYYIFKSKFDKRAVNIKNLAKKVPKFFKLTKGISVKDIYPSDVVMDAHIDGGDMITDFISNINRCHLISERVKNFLEEQGFSDELMEYLPFSLRDKKGRPIKGTFYIANLLINIPCFDFDKSLCTRAETTGNILDVRTIELLREEIPEDAKLFRIAECPNRTVIRSDFLKLLEDEGFTGIDTVGLGEKLL